MKNLLRQYLGLDVEEFFVRMREVLSKEGYIRQTTSAQGNAITGGEYVELDFTTGSVIYDSVIQTGLLKFRAKPGMDKKTGASVFLRVTANGSGALFPGMKQTVGSNDFDRTQGAVNLIYLFYDGQDIWYNIQQEYVVSPDSVAPTVTGREIRVADDTHCYVLFDEEIDPAAIPQITEFDLVDVTGAPSSCTLVGVTRTQINELCIETSTTLVSGNSYELTYTGTTIQDISGNKLATFADQAVVNNLATYDPDDYVPQAAAFLRSYSSTLNDNDPVTGETNYGSKGGATWHTLVGGAARPIFIANQANGFGIYRHTSADSSRMHPVNPFVLSNVYTLIVLANIPADNQMIIVSHALRGLGITINFSGTNNLTFNAAASGRTPSNITSNGTWPVGGWKLITAIAGNSTTKIRFNGAQDKSEACTVSVGNSGSDYILSGQPGNYADMDLAVIALWETEMALADIEKMEGAFAWKYGLQSILDAGHPYKSSPPAP